MRVRLVAALVMVCVLAAGAWASPSIDVGTIEAYPDTTLTFPVVVGGGGLVRGLDFYVQVGDGGAVNGGAGTRPVITAVDIVGPGTLFSTSHTGQATAFASDLLWAASTTTDPGQAEYLDADGVLAYITLDTSGTVVGESYALRLSGVAAGIFGSPGVDTAFADVPALITNGQISIVAAPLPATLTWLGAEDEHWANTLNWSTGRTPQPQQTVVFDALAPHQPTLTADVEVAGIEFLSAGWTLLGDGHTLSIADAGVLSAGSGVNGIDALVKLVEDAAFDVDAGNRLRLMDRVDGSGFDLTKTGAGTLDVEGALRVDALNIDSGTLRLVGGNTWMVTSLSFGESASMQFTPEPASLGLLASGLAALLVRRRMP
ncbi:MAG: PEP-CTERM sorting domain-containing protein [Acidobacteria bacterium]|nr:PEP-CTERM sorting domain-containing protein [Acidobacteriota bacterium]